MTDIKSVRQNILEILVPKYVVEMNGCKTVTDCQLITSNLVRSLGDVANLKENAWETWFSLMNNSIGDRIDCLFNEFHTFRKITKEEIDGMKMCKVTPESKSLLDNLYKLSAGQRKIVDEIG